MAQTFADAPRGAIFQDRRSENEAPVRARPPASPTFWQHLLSALHESRRRQAEREIARYLEAAGPFTDAVEREMERRIHTGGLRDI